jgi:hypothetical protein
MFLRMRQGCVNLQAGFAVTLQSPWIRRSHLLRRRFQFERCCSQMRHGVQTKREHDGRNVNERLRKTLILRA